MRIKRKKYYSSPKVDSVNLDKSVSLVLMTTPPPDPTAAPVEGDKPSFGPSSVPPSAASNPFGGSTPDYGDM